MQQQYVFWCFGLSGAGKTTLTQLAAEKLRKQNHQIFIVDGDELRRGLCQELGFDELDRMENVRRAAEVAKLAADQGMLVLVALMTPLKGMRDIARCIIGDSRFLEVYVSCSYDTCAKRDPKGLYVRAAQENIHHFSGKDAAFEAPDSPALVIETEKQSSKDSLNILLTFIHNQSFNIEHTNTTIKK